MCTPEQAGVIGSGKKIVFSTRATIRRKLYPDHLKRLGLRYWSFMFAPKS